MPTDPLCHPTTFFGKASLLDARERHFRIPSHLPRLSLFLRHRPPIAGANSRAAPVLYIHGATFPSGLSIAHRFDGWSWRDALNAAGFDVWGLDFLGFGLSDCYPEMSAPPDGASALGRAEAASRQIEAAVRFIAAEREVQRISLVSHSWGTIAAGRFAGRCPDLVERLVFFGPIVRRPGAEGVPQLPAWRLITLEEQWRRFVEDVPPGEPPVLSCRHFATWGEAWLDTDPDSRDRRPAGVKTPCGPIQDILATWTGELAYDPGKIRAPTAIIRGEWDGLCTDVDARWLFDALKGSPLRRDVKIARGTHLMHLEEGRHTLHCETIAFLAEGDVAPQPTTTKEKEQCSR